MKIEKERKWLFEIENFELITKTPLKSLRRIVMHVGYFLKEPMSIRVRSEIYSDGMTVTKEEAHFNTKIPYASGESLEIEHVINNTQAKVLIAQAPAKISKVRYLFMDNGLNWELDVINLNHDRRLCIAELENQEIPDLRIPKWLGLEVTGDKLFSNASIAFSQIPK